VGAGFRVVGSWFLVQGLGFRVEEDLGLRAEGLGITDSELELVVWVSFRVHIERV